MSYFNLQAKKANNINAVGIEFLRFFLSFRQQHIPFSTHFRSAIGRYWILPSFCFADVTENLSMTLDFCVQAEMRPNRSLKSDHKSAKAREKRVTIGNPGKKLSDFEVFFASECTEYRWKICFLRQTLCPRRKTFLSRTSTMFLQYRRFIFWLGHFSESEVFYLFLIVQKYDLNKILKPWDLKKIIK
jgi:hypothetical protein